MILIRSILFDIAYFLNCVFWFLFALTGYVIPKRYFMYYCWGWGRTSDWLLRKIVGVRIEYRGLERIPETGYICAIKHQSSWETFALLRFFSHPTFIYKRELHYIPLFGWHIQRAQQIPVDRNAKGVALAKMMVAARGAVAAGRQILIFPEGTRTAVGAAPDYKFGVARMYTAMKATCVPVALNSGLAWPRNSFMKYPVPIIVEFLEPIAPGMKADEFAALLQDRIETATARLVDEARTEAGQSRSVIQDKVAS